MKPDGALVIHVPGGDARLRVVSTHGETFVPADALRFDVNGGSFHPLREDVHVPLPPGSYTVEAMRGFQREVFTKAVEVVVSHETRVVAELPRIVDWSAHGWFLGDHRVFSAAPDGTAPSMSLDDLCRLARGEGLDYLSICGSIGEQHAYADWRDAGRPAEARPEGACDDGGFLSVVSYEAANDVLGHTCLVNAPGQAFPVSPENLAPTQAEFMLAMRRGDRRGTTGASAMAHPFAGLTATRLFAGLADPEERRVHRELPVDVALGFSDTFDFLSDDPPEDFDLLFEEYFRLLNLGLRIGVSGSSGAHAGLGTGLIGSIATGVRAELFHMDTIAAGYEAQRTLATNGPVLQFRANDHELGSTVSGKRVRLKADAYSNWGLTRLEVVANGEVVAEATPADDGWARMDTEWAPQASGWLIARAWGPGHPALNIRCVPESLRAEKGQWAVTSPIYVEVPGRPLRPRREDAEHYIRWIDACARAIRTRESIPGCEGTVRQVLDLFYRGRSFYEDLAAEG